MSEHIRSRTEPSTPLRSSGIDIPPSGPFSSIRRPSSRDSIRLPPYELPQVTARLNNVPRSRSRSRPRTPRETPGNSPGVTPTRYRRASQVIDQRNKRRRRSSMLFTEAGEPVYDPTYAGPITIDYLRFWCKVSVKEKQRKKESVKIHSPPTPQPIPTTENKESIDKREISPNKDLSLPLPSDDLLRSPFQLEHNYSPQPETPSLEYAQPPEPPKPKAFSYLEKILMARKQKRQLNSNGLRESVDYVDFGLAKPILDNIEPPREETEERKTDNMSQRRENRNVSSFVFELPEMNEAIDLEIEQTKVSGQNEPTEAGQQIARESELQDTDPGHSTIMREPELPDTTEPGDRPISQDIGVPISDVPVDTQTAQNSPQESPQDAISGGSQLNEDETNEGFQLNEESEINRFQLVSPTNLSVTQVSRLTSPLPETITTPQQEISPFRSDSVDQIIQEDYTFGDHNISHTFINSPSEKAEGEEEIEKIPTQHVPPSSISSRVLPARILPSRIPSTRPTSSMPLTAVKNLVKSVRLNSIQKTKRRKPQHFTQDIYKILQAKSDEFLDSLVQDLHAYASHRTGSATPRINLSDVLLYLNRVKFAGTKDNRASEIKRISSLAQNHLPLELLISLDQNLNRGKINLQEFEESEEESDEENEEEELSPGSDTDEYTE